MNKTLEIIVLVAKQTANCDFYVESVRRSYGVDHEFETVTAKVLKLFDKQGNMGGFRSACSCETVGGSSPNVADSGY